MACSCMTLWFSLLVLTVAPSATQVDFGIEFKFTNGTHDQFRLQVHGFYVYNDEGVPLSWSAVHGVALAWPAGRLGDAEKQLGWGANASGCCDRPAGKVCSYDWTIRRLGQVLTPYLRKVGHANQHMAALLPIILQCSRFGGACDATESIFCQPATDCLCCMAAAHSFADLPFRGR